MAHVEGGGCGHRPAIEEGIRPCRVVCKDGGVPAIRSGEDMGLRCRGDKLAGHDSGGLHLCELRRYMPLRLTLRVYAVEPVVACNDGEHMAAESMDPCNDGNGNTGRQGKAGTHNSPRPRVERRVLPPPVDECGRVRQLQRILRIAKLRHRQPRPAILAYELPGRQLPNMGFVRRDDKLESRAMLNPVTRSGQC
jgi:hypothetical protein